MCQWYPGSMLTITVVSRIVSPSPKCNLHGEAYLWSRWTASAIPRPNSFAVSAIGRQANSKKAGLGSEAPVEYDAKWFAFGRRLVSFHNNIDKQIQILQRSWKILASLVGGHLIQGMASQVPGHLDSKLLLRSHKTLEAMIFIQKLRWYGLIVHEILKDVNELCWSLLVRYILALRTYYFSYAHHTTPC